MNRAEMTPERGYGAVVFSTNLPPEVDPAPGKVDGYLEGSIFPKLSDVAVTFTPPYSKQISRNLNNPGILEGRAVQLFGREVFVDTQVSIGPEEQDSRIRTTISYHCLGEAGKLAKAVIDHFQMVYERADENLQRMITEEEQ